MCASILRRRETRKISSIDQRDVENYTRQALNFLFFDQHEYIYTESSVCNSGQYTYITGLFNFFFVLQDLIDINDFYFQRIAIQSNLLLIGFWRSTSQVFFRSNQQLSQEWRCVNSKGETMAESGRWISNIKTSILSRKGWFSYVRVSLKPEE